MNQTHRLYTIKEVASRTGLSTQLIRKWEERYGAVAPVRLPNGYRGYTKRDLDTLIWLKQRVDESVPIGMAVMEHKSRSAAEAETARGPILQGAVNQPGQQASAADWQIAVNRLLDYFEGLDYPSAQRYFEQLMSVHSLDDLLMNIMEPALVELGERWESGRISEYQEHFGSHFIRDKLLSLRNLFRAETDSPLLVTACGPGERHELGILYLGFFATQQGFRVAYLGASPAEKGILDCLREMKPAAFAFSFSSHARYEAALPFLLELDARIPVDSPHTLVFIGGRAVEEDKLIPGSKSSFLIAGDGPSSMAKIKSRLGQP
ncbi:MerR family transcriptional regulator [Paenibacillus sambharensis]|uniref:MerR family transcriptional regulator n=1 Tax=Paenibacillus sambharensis TaxID=1803190 RepID=A0A2W1L4C1_9BACL|nr:cobalamin B12-binding domain-containing protein [Paenibacillus sambharensis]PZD93803.1 MerR family transcriptional regulator [Paenibacillus sambharensis]